MKKIIILSQSDNYNVSGLIRHLIKMFYKDWIVDYFKENCIELITSKYIKEVIKKTEIEYLKEINSLENCIIFAIHPFSWEMAIEYCPNIKKIIWQDDLHYFANFVERKGESIQKYVGKFDIKYINDIESLVTPSYIYFKNLGIESNKLKDFFYFLDEDLYSITGNLDYDKRIKKIVLSGAIYFSVDGYGYKSRLEFDELRKKEIFDNLIYKIKHPGYDDNEHMTEIKYYDELTKYKAAFVGHHTYPINFLLAKHIEVLMCGCLGFFEPNPLLKEQLGLLEYVHYIPCFDENGLIKDPQFYTDWINSEEGKKISISGREYVRNKFGKEYIKNFLNFLISSF